MAKGAKPRSRKNSRKSRVKKQVFKESRTAAARDAVFETFELLEQILSHLDVVSISRAIAVNSVFHNVIWSSELLNRQCFLLAEAERYDYACDSNTGRVRRASAIDETDIRCHPIVANPLSGIKLHFEIDYGVYSGFPWTRLGNEVAADTLIDLHSLPAGHVYRRMFLSQPPSTSVGIRMIRRQYMSETVIERICIRCSTGVTIGMVLEQVEQYKDGLLDHDPDDYGVYLGPHDSVRRNGVYDFVDAYRLQRDPYYESDERLFESWGPDNLQIVHY